jgi:hypothetical protein
MKSMDKVEQAYKDALQRAEAIYKTAEDRVAKDKNDTVNANKDRDAAIDDEIKKANTEKEKFKESTNSVLNTFLEAEINTNNNASGGASKSDNIIRADGNQTNTSKASAGAKDTTKTADAQASDIKAKAGDNAADANIQGTKVAKVGDGVAGVDTSEKIKEFSNLAVKYINAYSNARTTAFAAMLNGLSSMQKEYLQVIRAHVNTYLGTVSDVEDDTNKTAT